MSTIWRKSFSGKDNHYYIIEVVKTQEEVYEISLTAADTRDAYAASSMTISSEDFTVLHALLGEARLQIPGNPDILPAYLRSHGHVDKKLDAVMLEKRKLAERLNMKALKHVEHIIAASKPEADVVIYIADAEVAHLAAEAMTNSAGEFMEALGYELKSEDEPVYGSFWKRIQFILNRQVSAEELDRAITRGKKALELKYVELPTAEQTEKLANAAKSLIESMQGFNDAVARLGALLVLKRTVDGEPKVMIQQLSAELIAILDEKPQLLRSPQTIYELITGDVEGEDDADDSTAKIGTAVLPEE